MRKEDAGRRRARGTRRHLAKNAEIVADGGRARGATDHLTKEAELVLAHPVRTQSFCVRSKDAPIVVQKARHT